MVKIEQPVQHKIVMRQFELVGSQLIALHGSRILDLERVGNIALSAAILRLHRFRCSPEPFEVLFLNIDDLFGQSRRDERLGNVIAQLLKADVRLSLARGHARCRHLAVQFRHSP